MLTGLVRAAAQAWYGKDRAAQAWEPSGEDFLSPTLTEAQLMRRVLTFDAFRNWLFHFLPELGDGLPATLFEPARVSDRSDGRIVHLDGLNLSRAWAWRAPVAGPGRPGRRARRTGRPSPPRRQPAPRDRRLRRRALAGDLCPVGDGRRLRR